MKSKQFEVIHEINAEYRQVHADLEAESDRSAAILGAAYLDDLLGRLLKHNPGPAGAARASGFHDRIEAALKAELIPPIIAADLHIVRQIRNRFGHEWRARTLAEADSQALVAKLNLRKAVANEDLEGYPDIHRRIHRQAIASLRAELAYATSLDHVPADPSPATTIYQLVLAGRTAAPTFGVVSQRY